MLNDNEHGIEYLNKLNGDKYFIRGNHDTTTRVNLYINNELIFCGDATTIKYGKYHFYLSHYPTLTGNLEKETLKQMTLNIYGHTHQTSKFFEDRPYMYCVCLDAHNCYPVLLDDIIKDMENKVIECKNML